MEVLVGLFGRKENRTPVGVDAWRKRMRPANRLPFRFENVGGFKRLYGEDSSIFAVRADGTLYSWGPPSFGDREYLGQGSSPLPDRLGRVHGISGIRDLQTDVGVTAALTDDGALYVWGRRRPRGPGWGGADDEPWRVPDLPPIRELHVQLGSYFAVADSGDVYAWGSNEHSQLGLGDADERTQPERIPELHNVTVLIVDSVWDRPILAATADRELFYWNPKPPQAWRPAETPALVPGVPGVKEFKRSDSGQILIGQDDELYQVKPGAYDFWESANQPPTGVRLGVSGVKQLTYDYAVDGNGALWTWGKRAPRVLGLDGIEAVDKPVPVPGLEHIAQVSDSTASMHAVTRAGSVWAWGANGRGELGLGDSSSHPTPTRVRSLSSIRAVADRGAYNGGSAKFAIDTSGKLYAWGDNTFGRLGVGDESDRDTPTLVTGLPPVERTELLTPTTTTVITGDGALWSWGGDHDGDLGVGKTRSERVLRPKPVRGLPPVAATHEHLDLRFALTRAGHIYIWGI